MEIEPIEATEHRGETAAEIWAARLADRLEEMRSVSTTPPSADAASTEPVSTAPASPVMQAAATYSPAVLALAASAQVYTANGTVSTLGSAAAHAQARDAHRNEIKAVSAIRKMHESYQS